VLLLITRESLDGALARIEWPTLFFFIGLFVMVGALEETGAIRAIADGVTTITGGDRIAELMGITWVSALASGVVDNIPFTATMIPVVERLEGGTQDNAYWWALALGACFGGNFTLVAAAANVAAAGLAERAGRPIGFVEFLKIGIPATLASLVLATLYLSRGTREGARSGSRVQPPTESWACQPRSVPATGPA
jgi:Na+/H+ antiporter NhaD/arsenite permease-like protein